MFIDYFYWHYVWAPRWLISFSWTLQRALWQFFSVWLLIRTLYAPWHQDRIKYHGGTVSGILTTFAWNQISRAIGLVVRLVALSLWLVSEVIITIGTGVVWILFLLWPLITLITFGAGLTLLFY